MVQPRKKPATYDDLLKLPDNVVGEIVAGELFVSPRPAPRHANASSVLGGELDPFHRDKGGPRGPGGWWILDEPELHLHADILVPDLAGWRRERIPRLPAGAAFELAPDWICEVLSPSTAVLDRTKKLGVYAREGVSHAWLVDPQLRTLEVLRRTPEGQWLQVTTLGPDSEPLVRVEPFAEIEIELGRLWVDD